MDSPKKPKENKPPEEPEVLIVKKDWIVDSGASDHVCRDYSLFTSFRPLSHQIKVAKKSQRMYALGEGVIETKHFTLERVFYTPEVVMNVLSVPTLTETIGNVQFCKHKVEIKMKDGQVILGSKDKNKTFKINLEHKIKKKFYFPVKRLHSELEAFNNESLRKLQKTDDVGDIEMVAGFSGGNNNNNLEELVEEEISNEPPDSSAERQIYVILDVDVADVSASCGPEMEDLEEAINQEEVINGIPQQEVEIADVLDGNVDEAPLPVDPEMEHDFEEDNTIQEVINGIPQVEIEIQDFDVDVAPLSSDQDMEDN